MKERGLGRKDVTGSHAMINSGGPLHQAGEFRGLVGRIREAFLREVAPPRRGLKEE